MSENKFYILNENDEPIEVDCDQWYDYVEANGLLMKRDLFSYRDSNDVERWVCVSTGFKSLGINPEELFITNVYIDSERFESFRFKAMTEAFKHHNLMLDELKLTFGSIEDIRKKNGRS